MEHCGMTMNIVDAGPDALISIRDVSVAYGTRRVLDRVSLDIYRGEIVALLGGSGSGKTTLLRRVIGLEPPDSGSIVIGGIDLTAGSDAELAAVRRQVGVAFQESALFSSLTVDENAALPIRELTDLADPIVAQMVWMKLKAVGLADAGRLYPRELSGGMKKRAAIARAIALDPDILVLDEPSAGLDPIIAAGLDELILFLKRGLGMTVLVVTHALDSAFRIADRVAMLYQGSLIAVGTPAEFKASTHPRVRQFVQGESERLSDAAEGFAVSFLKEFHA
jgi:phospholipid/cholesterol/gamma-HCH transport system ATP-binding protein